MIRRLTLRSFPWIVSKFRSISLAMATPSKLPKVDSASSSGGIHEEIKRDRLKTASSPAEFSFNEKRVNKLIDDPGFLNRECKAVAYWMSRDQRVQDNWALIYAQRIALEHRLPLHVIFCLVPKFLGATLRHYDFMIKGLQEVAEECKALDIEFHLLLGEAKNVIPNFVADASIGCLVTDMSPLRVPRQWTEDLKKALPSKSFCFHQVDAHNIVPIWEASNKQEYGARTIRPKITNQLPEFLTDFPPVVQHPFKPAKSRAQDIDWKKVYDSLEVDKTVEPVAKTKPGTKAGLENLEDFVKRRLKLYNDKRNDPSENKALSGISPWRHFGQISVQRCILFAKKHGKSNKAALDSFIEEAVVRRELADNFCYYQENYDNLKGAFDWAKKSLRDHEKDKREYLYSRDQLEKGETHDDLWNAAQIQMTKEGKMHGFLRMYWAKKILEWTESPAQALEIAIYLNDRYELDGRDPSGYVGCMWSICGIHDQGWAERAVFGKIRYMNYKGCQRKFDVAKFVNKYGAKAHPYKGKK